MNGTKIEFPVEGVPFSELECGQVFTVDFNSNLYQKRGSHIHEPGFNAWNITEGTQANLVEDKVYCRPVSKLTITY